MKTGNNTTNDVPYDEPITPHLEKLIKEFENEIARGEVSEPFDISDREGMKRFLEDLKADD